MSASACDYYEIFWKNKRPDLPTFDAEGYQTDRKDLNDTPLPDLRKVQARSLWGGARKGAGRKSMGRQPVLLRLTSKTIRRLRAAARKQGKALSAAAEEWLVIPRKYNAIISIL